MAIVEDATNTYEVFEEVSLTSPASAVEAGAGGNDIPELSQDRLNFLQTFAQAPVTNQSSYTLYSGVVDRDIKPFDHRWTDGEQQHVREPAAEGGSGGGVMGIFSQSRTDFLSTVGGIPVTNNSQYPLPSAVVDRDTKPFDHRWTDGERLMGTSISGFTADGQGDPLNGDVKIYDSTQVYVEKNVSAQFVVRSPPPNAVVQGAESGGSSINFDFDPTRPGVTFRREGVGSGLKDVAIEYGDVVGTITDFNDDPVANESVEALGAGASTDSNGRYTFLAPGGESVEFVSLAGMVSKSRTPVARSEISIDWQFAGVKASLRLPDGTNIPNAPVEIDTPEGRRRTDQGGEYQYIRVPPNVEVNLEYLETYTQTFTTANEGQNTEAPLELGAGCKGSIISERANPIEGVDLEMDVEGVPISYSREDGQFALGVLNPGDMKVVCAKEDRRFNRNDETLELQDGEVEDVNFQLTDARNLGNAV